METNLYQLKWTIPCNFKYSNWLQEWSYETIIWKYNHGIEYFNLDEKTMSWLIEVHMVHNMHTDDSLFVDVEPTVE